MIEYSGKDGENKPDSIKISLEKEGSPGANRQGQLCSVTNEKDVSGQHVISEELNFYTENKY